MNISAKIKVHKIDKAYLASIGFLLAFGILILSSASLNLGERNFGDATYYLRHQLFYGLTLGLLGFFLVSKIPYKFWRNYSFLFLIFSMGLLTLLFVPKLGIAFGGATRWLKIGFINFQPSEILKLAFLVYLASWFESRYRTDSNASHSLIPFLIIIALIGSLLILQPDMGTFGVIAVSAVLVYLMAGGKISHLAILAGIGILAFAVLVWVAPYRLDRLTIFLNPQKDPQGAGFHINQALTAIGVGGVGGVGLGRSKVSDYLPETIGDSIFAVIAEELGLLGVTITLLLYIFFGVRAYIIAKKSPDTFSRLLASGIAAWIFFQSFINAASISGLIPLTGVPLPFISYGSSSLVMSLMGAGILANISKYSTS